MISLSRRQLVRRVSEPWLNPDTAQERTVIVHDMRLQDVALCAERVSQLQDTPNTRVHVSCDDGFYSSYTFLMRLNAPATFFVCPAFIDLRDGDWETFVRDRLHRLDDVQDADARAALRPCSWDDLRRLVGRGHTIGCHTMTHANLAACTSDASREREIIVSADLLEDRLGVPVRNMAFPFGTADHINRRAMGYIERRYDSCATGLRGNNAAARHPFLEWRDALSPEWDAAMMRFIVRGGLDWRYAWRRRRVRRCL